MFTDLLEMAIGDSENEKEVTEVDTSSSMQVRKAVDVEERRALWVVLEPQEGNETTDLHGDFYTEEDVVNAMRSFNTHCRKANLLHKVDVSTDKVIIEQSFCTPVAFDIELADGTLKHIKKSTWLMEQHYPKPDDDEDDTIWPDVVSGELCGLSINCDAYGYEVK